jgi:hypothetical protein
MYDVDNYGDIPGRTLDALIMYGRNHYPTGGFLRAVLANDLRGAINRADTGNLAALKLIVQFVSNEMPSGIWGSEKKVVKHLKKVGAERCC